MSDTKRAALEELGRHWMVEPRFPLASEALIHAFGRDRPRRLDIGCGNGEAAAAWAVAYPDDDVLAVELHRPGIVQLMRWLDEQPRVRAVTNLRVIEADATALVTGAEPGTFQHVRILFPDPWPKRRHRERRLVDTAFVHALADVVPPGGTLHLATDWDDYADQMRCALGAEPRFVRQRDAEGEPVDTPSEEADGAAWRSVRPARPTTAYERRGIDAGRHITDLAVRRA